MPLPTRQWLEVYDLCHTFCTLRESKNQKILWPCENRARFSHGHRFFDSRNVQKRATKSDTSAHCLLPTWTRNNSASWKALRLYNCYNHSPYAPGPQILRRAQLHVLWNSGSQMFMLTVKTLVTTDEIQKKKVESIAISEVQVSVQVHWHQVQCHTRWPRGWREFQHPAGVESM